MLEDQNHHQHEESQEQIFHGTEINGTVSTSEGIDADEHSEYTLILIWATLTKGSVYVSYWQTERFLNGIDYDIRNPYTGYRLYANYNITNVLDKKKESKQKLREELGLVQDDHKFVTGLISHLTDQKGLDLIPKQFFRETKMKMNRLYLSYQKKSDTIKHMK